MEEVRRDAVVQRADLRKIALERAGIHPTDSIGHRENQGTTCQLLALSVRAKKLHFSFPPHDAREQRNQNTVRGDFGKKPA